MTDAVKEARRALLEWFLPPGWKASPNALRLMRLSMGQIEDTWAAVARVLRWNGRRAMFRADSAMLAELETVIGEEQAAVLAFGRAVLEEAFEKDGDKHYLALRATLDALAGEPTKEEPVNDSEQRGQD